MPAIPPSPACSVRSSSALPPSSPPLHAPSPAFLAPELQKPFAVRPEERAPPSSELPLRTAAALRPFYPRATSAELPFVAEFREVNAGVRSTLSAVHSTLRSQGAAVRGAEELLRQLLPDVDRVSKALALKAEASAFGATQTRVQKLSDALDALERTVVAGVADADARHALALPADRRFPPPGVGGGGASEEIVGLTTTTVVSLPAQAMLSVAVEGAAPSSRCLIGLRRL